MKKKAKKRTHIRWNRVIAVVMIPLILISMYCLMSKDPIEYYDTTVVVKEGDTLWEIAKNAVGEKVDVREIIHDIITENGLENGNIQPGMHLKVKAVKH